MNPVRTKKLAIIALVAGAIIAVLGILIYLQGQIMPGVLVLIVGICIAMIGRSILGFFSKFEFERMRNKKD